MLTPKEVAERVGLSAHAVYRAIRRGDLEAFEIVPGRLRIEVTEYERWRHARRVATDSPAPIVEIEHRRQRKSKAPGGFAAQLREIEQEEGLD
jgi:excisionase family DNA binding protein